MQAMSIMIFDTIPITAPVIIDAIAQFFACFALSAACSSFPAFHCFFTDNALTIAMMARGQKLMADTAAHVRLLSGQFVQSTVSVSSGNKEPISPPVFVLFVVKYIIKKFFRKKGDKTMTKVDIFSGFLGAGKTTLIKKLIEIINERKPELIVVGLPKNMDGTEGARADLCRTFAQKVEEATGKLADFLSHYRQK